MLDRRRFLGVLSAGAASAALAACAPRQGERGATTGAKPTMSGPMNETLYRPVILAARPNARAVLSDAQRDDLEHHIHCQCGCTLDVYTCRTTDFTCPVSPGMHRDVIKLVAEGYTGTEILAAFRAVYGERVLMAPVREGFNWAAYVAPFVALGAAGTAVAVLIHRWRAPTAIAGGDAGEPSDGVAPPGAARQPVQATPDELARLDAAIRDDSN